MIISLQEIVDLILMTLVVGYIFSDMFNRRVSLEKYDPLKQATKTIDWESIKIAAIVTAPGIILHEFAHKFVAIAYGLSAVFHASYFWLGIGLIMKMLGTGFVFFVPGFVSIAGGEAMQLIFIAFAGPFMNALLWFIGWLIIKQNWIQKKYIPLIYAFKQINMFLFVFNMLPIPGFDGFSAYYQLY